MMIWLHDINIVSPAYRQVRGWGGSYFISSSGPFAVQVRAHAVP
jgi:hypothetical protein